MQTETEPIIRTDSDATWVELDGNVFAWPWEKSNRKNMNHLETFLANIDPGGAVGGRFMRIFDASGASDARRIFDKSMAIGSSDSFDSMIPPSSWNDTEIESREMNGICISVEIENTFVARTRFANFAEWRTTFRTRQITFDRMLFLFGITAARTQQWDECHNIAHTDCRSRSSLSGNFQYFVFWSRR